MDASPKIYGLTFNEQPLYLHVHVTAARIDRDRAMSLLSEVMTECANRRCKQLLLERDSPEIGAHDELFDGMKDMVEMDSGTRIAFLVPHAAAERSLWHTRNNGTKRRGDFRFFRSKNEAIEWLVEGTEVERENEN
jgi:hypothetical protein